MKENLRDAVAYIIGRLITDKNRGNIYSYDKQQYINFMGTVSKKSINVYDERTKQYITALGNDNNQYSLYNYDTRKYINLNIRDNQFSGYDYETSQSFSGTVNISGISFYDYEDSKYYNYAL